MGLDINLKLIFRLPEHQQNCYWRGWGVTLSLIFVLILTLGAPLEMHKSEGNIKIFKIFSPKHASPAFQHIALVKPLNSET
jgi:hypothetical protein